MENKLKWILGGLGLLVILLSVSSWYSNRLLRKEKDRTSYYYSLFKEVENKKDSLQHHTDSIQVILDKYRYLIDSLETAIVGLNDQTSYLNSKLEEALEEIESVSYDDNYAWLQNRYPTKDTLEYPFSGNQVKEITRTIVTFDYTDSLYQNQIDISILQQGQLKYKDEMITILEREKDNMNDEIKKLYDRIALKINENQLKDEEIAKLKKALRLWQVGAISGGGFVVLALLLL